MDNAKLQEMIERAGKATLDRRSLMWRSALGGSAAAVAFASRRGWASAQDGSPAAGGSAVDLTKSISREEYYALLDEVYPRNADAPKGGTLIHGDSSDINTVNAILGDNAPTNDINLLVFETLTSSDATRPSYVPGLADSWELGADGKTYTFKLNQSAKWHDGQPFTADDVIFSFDAQSNPDVGSSYTGTFTGFVASYEKLDDYTVSVVTTDTFAPLAFFGNFYCPIMPKHIWEGVDPKTWADDGGSTGEDPSRVIGTGPFKFVSWTQGEKVELVRNDEYWDTNAIPNIENFTFVVWPDDSAAVEALRSGAIDTFENVPPADTQSVADEDSVDVTIFDTVNFTFYGYNLDPEKTPLFQEKEVRQALFYALDRQSIVDNILLGYAEVAQGSQPKLSPAYAPDEITTHYNYDPDKAMQLLDGAGWVAGDDGVRAKDGNKLEFEVMYTGSVAVYNQLVPYMQEAWDAIGVKMTPNGVDFGSVLIPAITETYDYQIALLGFSWDVTGDQTAMFSSTSYGPTGFNFMKYSNADVDRLNSEANVELDAAKRRDLLVQSANLVNDDLPVGILSFGRNRDGYNVRVKNWNPNGYAGLLWSIPFAWIEE